ncbi:MAG: winged helix-turn-helix domain-containing protein [Cryobacterium sp.]|nr:winged helix-turn-helix domain-containing protein [Oligoflexia bacterium]
MQPSFYPSESPLRALVARGQLFLEKCELVLAKEAFLEVVTRATELGDRESLIEAIAVLLRLSAEAKEEASIAYWDAELEKNLPGVSGKTLAMALHNRSVVATHKDRIREAQTYLYQALRAFRQGTDAANLSPLDERFYVKIWASLTATFMDRGLNRRAALSAEALIARYDGRGFHSEMTTLFITRGIFDERGRRFEAAREWYQKAHGAALTGRNWYFHLYVLYAYARVERHVRNFAQAYWNLDLVSRAASGPEFANLQDLVTAERKRLEDDAVDLLVDARQSAIRTREKKNMSLGKQYVLLGILEALTEAHYKDAPDSERGLSKAEIIERVWSEKYKPESHDNKLYYNINRLRKLIEPDMRHPKYLLNWKEGYRLAPGLKVQYIGGTTNGKKGN